MKPPTALVLPLAQMSAAKAVILAHSPRSDRVVRRTALRSPAAKNLDNTLGARLAEERDLSPSIDNAAFPAALSTDSTNEVDARH